MPDTEAPDPRWTPTRRPRGRALTPDQLGLEAPTPTEGEDQ